MMNRRQFIYRATAASIGIPRVFGAAKYDLIVKGGRVVDPSRKLNAIRDVAIANGRIAAIGGNISRRRHRNHRRAAASWWCRA